MGVQKFDGIQEKIEGGKNSSLTTILSIWNCVMGSSLLSHASYLLKILNIFYKEKHWKFLRWKYWIEIKYAMGVRKSWFHANGIHHGLVWYYVLLYCLSLHKSCRKGTRKIRKNCWSRTTRISGWLFIINIGINTETEPYLANYQNQKVVKLLTILDWWYSHCTHYSTNII